ncbi:MAG: hypothetical protein ACFFCW_37450 [Candidatus Hodarchaeota archaeon]
MQDYLLKLIKTIQFPTPDEAWRTEVSAGLRKATSELRRGYYKACPVRNSPYETPFGGPITDSVGPWPEFILRGLPCQKSTKGCCTPCFYSRIPQVNLDAEYIYESLMGQTAYILEKFDSLVRNNQEGPVAFDKTDSINKSRQPLAFVLTPTGSFFDDKEFPFTIREKILRMLLEHSGAIKHPFALHIETHAEDFLYAAEKTNEFNRVIDLLQKLNGRILFGFESRNDFVRNILYNKFLDILTFESAIKLAHRYELGVGAFTFVGINPLKDIEILADAVGTLDFLENADVSPVLMFHNVQPYTIQELLYCYKAHRLPEPRTVLEVIQYLVAMTHKNRNDRIDTWLVADPIGGPPPPKYNIFSSADNVTCRKCSDTIYSAIVSLRTTRNIENFLKSYNELKQCRCAKKYHDLLLAQASENKNLQRRVEMMLETIKQRTYDYISVVRPIMNETEDYSVFDDATADQGLQSMSVSYPELKAELLCHGLRIDKETESDVIAYNSYVKEAGFVHAAHFLVNGKIINACVSERFCRESPFILSKQNDQYQLFREKLAVAQCDVMRLPAWCNKTINGYKMGDILRPHSPNVISGMPDPKCHYYMKQKQCKFCSLEPLQNVEPIDKQIVAEVAFFALQNNPSYELSRFE